MLWEDFSFMSRHLDVWVVSSDGWMWMLAWKQIGVDFVNCVATNEAAARQLDEFLGQAPFEGVSLREADDIKYTDKLKVICYHMSELDSLEDEPISEILNSHNTPSTIHIITMRTSTSREKVWRRKCPGLEGWQQLRHIALGGLTTARVTVAWSKSLGQMTLVSQIPLKRPFDRFLEPAARLVEWRNVKTRTSTNCWDPTGGPFPWPWVSAPTWVETYSVFFSKVIQRKFTPKEKAQLADLRQEWAAVTDAYWSWLGGCAPPLRMFVETITTLRSALRRTLQLEEEKEGETKSNLKDWGRIRAPWVGHGDWVDSHGRIERIKYFGWVWNVAEMVDISVACKGDDAGVNLALWAVGGDSEAHERARGILRGLLWRWWIKRLTLEGVRWLQAHKTKENALGVQDCVRRCADSTWWSREHGSRLIFWRWPLVWIEEARDGAKGFHTKRPQPQLSFPPVPIDDQRIIDKDLEKLEKLLRRGYIVPGHCRTTVPRFPVPKGTDDIRVVWDLRKNGVNETMYTPTFFLANMTTYTRRVETGAFGGDFDVGEQFHNYCLHPSEQPHCGVEIPDLLLEKLRNEGMRVDKYMRWTRLVFGWQSSPYMALRMFARAIEMAKGPPEAHGSAFGWSTVELNLPGDPTYNPGLPRVRKLTESERPSPDIVTFYDDGRVFGPDEVSTHHALRQITSRIQHFGNQDAARKRRLISQRPGAWAGGIVYSDQGLLRVFVSPEKWKKAQEFLRWTWEHMHKGDGALDRKVFRSGKGFLVHMSTCYEFIQPYLKGFHLSEESWRWNRDSEGWVDDDASIDSIEDRIEEGFEKPPVKGAPALVKPVPRLRDDVEVLLRYFQGDTPVQVIARPVEGSSFVAYGGGDASGEGFGGHITPLGMRPLLRRGFWCKGDSEESSNWRELRNLIDTIREEAERGRLVGRELWVATDNSTAANAFYKGTSKSRLLHDMVTELRLLMIRGNFVLRLYHIPGTRMIASGIDALSRGELDIEKLTNAVKILMPLNRSPLERSETLKIWLKEWLGQHFHIATPSDWFYNAHQSRMDYNANEQESVTWVWDLPPAAALHALEELGQARIKRHNTLRGVVLLPTLLSHEWFRRFSRIVDFYFTISPGSISAWPFDMYEPLTVGIYLPLFRSRPWDWKRAAFLVQFGRSMSALYKSSDAEAGNILRQFWSASSRIDTMPKRLVYDMLQNPSWRRFLYLSGER